MRKFKYQYPIKGQRFKTDKGIFEVVGVWFRNEIANELEILEVDSGQIRTVTIENFIQHESRITYLDNSLK